MNQDTPTLPPPEALTYTVDRHKLVAVLGELPHDTRARMRAVLEEMRYDRIVLNREGHEAPWNITAFDVRRVEAAVARQPTATAAKLKNHLHFRPEHSRPEWRNIHTGATTVITDLAVNDHGGFQGGCRQHVVVTDEPPPPGPPAPPPPPGKGPRGHNVYALWAFLEHWEPTGKHVPVSDLTNRLESA